MVFHEKTVNREIIYKGKILNLRRDTVKVKSGKTSYREIIEHNGGSVAVAITDDKKVLLVKQYRQAMEKEMLELPAGKIEPGEDPLETMKRELVEETGYSADNMKLIGKFNPSVGYTSETLYIYLATGLTKGKTNFDPDEDIELFEVDIEKALEMIVNGDITDGKTMAGILLLPYHMKP